MAEGLIPIARSQWSSLILKEKKILIQRANFCVQRAIEVPIRIHREPRLRGILQWVMFYLLYASPKSARSVFIKEFTVSALQISYVDSYFLICSLYCIASFIVFGTEAETRKHTVWFTNLIVPSPVQSIYAQNVLYRLRHLPNPYLTFRLRERHNEVSLW